MSSSTITGIHLVPGHSAYVPSTTIPQQAFAVGLGIDNAEIVWGDCRLSHDWLKRQEVTYDVQLLSEPITRSLVGQRLDSFRQLAGLVRPPSTGNDELLAHASIRTGIQQALLQAVAKAHNRTLGAIVLEEYKLTARPEAQALPVTIEIGNEIATLERINEMIALRPAGLGYALVAGSAEESIGEDAGYLQRFVRELVAHVPTIVPDDSYRPSFLLRLNGALGELTTDPRQHLGKVLGGAVGLEQAAGDHSLRIVDPVVLDDLAAQAATMQRLRVFMHRRDMTTSLVVEQGIQNLADLDLVIQSEAGHAILVFLAEWADLDQLLQAASACQTAGMTLLIGCPLSFTVRQLDLFVALASRLAGVELVVGVDSGLPTLALRAVVASREAALSSDSR